MEKQFMSKINFDEIDRNALYEGYLWMSDKKKPEVYHNAVVDFSLFEKVNPFVIEGQLYDSNNKLSYSMKFVDGEYYIYEVKVTEDKSTCIEKIYCSNRMDNLQLIFRQYWKEVDDEYCLKMPVLVMDKEVFVGFKKMEGKLCLK